MKQILAVARKELSGFFGSPMALMFLGAFLVATLFTFFWVDTFFARNIADVRPMFRWMPILLIFLVAALTMRAWSEEQRAGTLEILLTLPVRPYQLVLGKFLAVMALVALALALTLPLPIMVAILGPLDWGPVVGGYLAALLLAAGYTALGLFVSSRTDNQIVALISTALLGGLLYLVGSAGVTDFFGATVGEVLRRIGTGSRFESIERGVIDLSDLIYYLSLTLLFLALNIFSLDRKRWSFGSLTAAYRRNANWGMGLLAANLLLLNIWVAPLSALRADITQERLYTLSPTTKDLLANLGEPLLIRAYISDRTHPLLAPLAPQVADMLREYEIAGRGKVQAEVVDPASDAELEAEANQVYGIQPVPFQVAGRYETSVINSYFHILIRYGDQNVVLSFDDLIDVTPHTDRQADVALGNLEYDLTSAVKKVVYGFQSVESVLAAQAEPVQLTLYATTATLPPDLVAAQQTIETVANDIAAKAGGKLEFAVVDPDAPGAPVTRQQLVDGYGLQPYPVDFLSNDTFYLHMTLVNGGQMSLIYPPAEINESTVRAAIESALKRSASGFLKVVGLWTPPAVPTQDMFGQSQPPLSTWQLLEQQLSSEYTVRPVELGSGAPPTDVDVLVVIAPQALDEKALFAIDQYLMRGGAVVLAAGTHTLGMDMMGSLALAPVEGGVGDLLQHYGIDLQPKLVMDEQNAPFPVLVNRNVGGFQMQEIQAIDYPFFVDVRADGMDKESPMLAGLPAVTMNWASPVVLDEASNAERTASVLLRSTDRAWLTEDLNIQPDFETYPDLGFAVGDQRQAYPLAVAVQGIFPSYFQGKQSPVGSAPSETAGGAAGDAAATATPAPLAGVIEQSPDTARLVVVGSAEFLNDFVLNLSARLSQDLPFNNLQFAQNAVDWAVEDLDLLSIRARGAGTQVLQPLNERQQTMWEVGQYLFALFALLAIGLVWQVGRRQEKPMRLTPRPAVGD